MADKCTRCPGLQAEIRGLQADVRQLRTQEAWLRRQLNGLFGGIVATVRLVTRERQAQRPTIPRSKLLPHVIDRLTAYIETTTRGEW